MAEKSSIFDRIGPIMIGPTGSHTAGVVRIARAAIHILGATFENAEITFYNSFARTYEGHGFDRAVVAGLLDFKTDDSRIKEAFAHAEAAGLKYTFKSVGNAATMHPNTIKIQVSHGEQTIEVVGQSRGGGIIRIVEVDGFPADFSANLHTLIVEADDVEGQHCFYCRSNCPRRLQYCHHDSLLKGENQVARQYIEMDTGLKLFTLAYIRQLSWIKRIIYIPNID